MSSGNTVVSESQGWEWFFSRLSTACAATEPAEPRARLERARSLIHTQFAQPLDLGTTASEANLSRYHFAREFKRHFDVTPHQYLTDRRIERAKQLLTGTDLSVTEICMCVGFSSLGSFCTLFQRRVGHSPGRFRRAWVQSLGVPAARPTIPSCFFAHFGPRVATG